MHQFEKLIFWQKSIQLTKNIYLACTEISHEEKFGLISQIKRAAISIPSNIAEGAGREREKEFYHFLNIAYGSSYELQTQLIICERLNFISIEINESLLNKLDEIQKMLFVFKENLKKNINI